jgi:adenylyltransferase/sulfurtransferase
MERVLQDRELPELTNDEIHRYSRHLLLPELGIEGQRRLKAARVLVVGTGGLGAPLLLYLAAAGVGTLGMVDFDFVEASNLQRQVIHGTRDLGRPKVASAQDRIKSINPYCKVIPYNTMLTSANALEILKDYDVVADGTDNYQTRYLVNDACVLLGIPNVYGSIFQFEGQASVFYAKQGPCYRCLYPEPPPPGLVPSCAEGGVVGVLPGMVGMIQANEVIKLIVGSGRNSPNQSISLVGRLLLVDAWKMKFRELQIDKDPACPLCGANPSIHELMDYEQFCGLKKEEEPVEIIEPEELKARLDAGEALQIIDIREPHERAIVKFPKAKPIPLGQMARRIGEFDPQVDAVFICTIGQRSVFAIRALREAGYTGRLLNLRDGMRGWATKVDSSFPVY